MKKLCYPCKGYVGKGKSFANNSEDFYVEFHGRRSLVHIACINDLELFLFGSGKDVGNFRFFWAFWRVLPFLTVHFYCLSVGGRAFYNSGIVSYRFSCSEVVVGDELEREAVDN